MYRGGGKNEGAKKKQMLLCTPFTKYAAPPLDFQVQTCDKLAFYKYLNGMCKVSHDICSMLAKVGLLNETNAIRVCFQLRL